MPFPVVVDIFHYSHPAVHARYTEEFLGAVAVKVADEEGIAVIDFMAVDLTTAEVRPLVIPAVVMIRNIGDELQHFHIKRTEIKLQLLRISSVVDGVGVTNSVILEVDKAVTVGFVAVAGHIVGVVVEQYLNAGRVLDLLVGNIGEVELDVSKGDIQGVGDDHIGLFAIATDSVAQAVMLGAVFRIVQRGGEIGGNGGHYAIGVSLVCFCRHNRIGISTDNIVIHQVAQLFREIGHIVSIGLREVLALELQHIV